MTSPIKDRDSAVAALWAAYSLLSDAGEVADRNPDVCLRIINAAKTLISESGELLAPGPHTNLDDPMVRGFSEVNVFAAHAYEKVNA